MPREPGRDARENQKYQPHDVERRDAAPLPVETQDRRDNGEDDDGANECREIRVDRCNADLVEHGCQSREQRSFARRSIVGP